ncbi:MAG: ATP-binding protein [Bacteroidales bacterium]|nr:ATP-binding protein [Bacteroidales bacterium]
MEKKTKFKLGNLLGMPTSGQEEWKLNPFTLKFAGNIQHLEKDFLKDYFERSINPFRFSILLAILIYDLFAYLDVIMYPDLRITFWIIRFGGVTPILLLVLLYSFSKNFKKYMQIVISAIMYITGLGIIVMIIIATIKANQYSYYAGLMLIIFFGYSFIKARFISAVIAGWSIVISYEIGAIWLADTPTEAIINNNFFFIAANVIGMFISYSMEHSARRDFYMRFLLQKEQDKVQAANNALEKRVADRTRQVTRANKDLKKEIEIRKHHESEKAKIESQLLQLQKMETIGTLAGGIAHDFNNILTPILGYTEMAIEELSDESTLKYDIEQINHAALRGKDLVQQILTFSRQVDFDKKPLHLHLVIKEVLNLVKASFPSNIEIKQDLDENCGTVMADSTQMHQVIMNIATNSYHAMMDKGGVLEIRLSAVNRKDIKVKSSSKLKENVYVMITVSDSGHGMDKQTIDRIFEPFFTNKEVGSGSGLGLSVVHGIVNNNNGAIEVESEPGKGTSITIYLPQHSVKGYEGESVDDKIEKGKGNILFVDDEKEITYMGKRMLESLGYKVEIKSGGSSALEEFKKNPDRFDLLVTDQAMPYMQGTELIEKIKAIRPEIKTIIITGFNDSIPRDATETLGIEAIITKPLILSEFSKLISKVLLKT